MSGGGDNWKDLKLNTKTKVKLDFKNANVDLVIGMFQKTSGVTIVKDPSLTGGITLTSASAVNLTTAFTILEKTLNLKGYDLKKDGTLLIIQKQQQQGRGGGFGGGNFDPSIFMNAGQSQSVLKNYPIKYANATAVAKVINDVFASNNQPTNPFAAFFQNQNQGNQGRFGQGGQGGRGGQRFGAQPFTMGGNTSNSQSNVRASSDDFSNSVFVNAPDKEQKEVERAIKAIDKQTDTPQRTKVYTLKFASASDVAPTVQNVLTNNAPRGVGGQTNSTGNPQDRFQQAIRFGSAQAAFGTVAADTRSNSLVVTATDESQAIVSQVLIDLDKPVEFANTTFVFPLNNAKADDVANLLNSTFGRRAGLTNPTTTNRTNTNQNRQTVPTTTGATNRVGGLTNDPNDPNNLYMQMQDPNATNGELLTSITAQGGFGGGGGGGNRGGGFQGGFGGGGTNSQNSTQLGRDANGQIIPLRDPTGQVTTIADPNTNSIIIVANPDYAEMIKKILEQLDKIPEQVMIETIIVEANLDAKDQLGVEWNYLDNGHLGVSGQQGNIGDTFGLKSTTNPLQGLVYTIGGKNLTSLINAIQTDTKFNILSTPRIFTSNNVQGIINISQSVPYITSSRTDTTGAVIYSYSSVDVGIVLTVTPRITANGYVTMDINQTANDLVGYTTFNAPIVNKREASTVVSVKTEETIILGGIIRNSITATTNKVPILGDIPILGKLFQSSSKEKQKTELLVLLKPRIVKDENEARRLRLNDQKELAPETMKELNKLIPPENTKTEIKDKKNGGN